MNIILDRYSQSNMGKFFKDSKRSHEWQFSINCEQMSIGIQESYSSKKLRFFFNNKLITELKAQEEDKKKGFDFQVDNLSIHVKRGQAQRDLVLYINNQLLSEEGVQNNLPISPAKKQIDYIPKP